MSAFCSFTKNLRLFDSAFNIHKSLRLLVINVRNKSRDVELPSNVGPAAGKFRRIVHYPEEYTVKPLEVTNLGGRDPKTGKKMNIKK